MAAIYASTDPAWIKEIRNLPFEAAKAFWQPTPACPKEIERGEFWFFKELGRPVIRGYGSFVAWEPMKARDLFAEYGNATGYESLDALLAGLRKFRSDASANTEVGNVILRDTHFFSPAPHLAELGLADLNARYAYIRTPETLQRLVRLDASPSRNERSPAPSSSPTTGIEPSEWKTEVVVTTSAESFVYGIRFGQHDIWKVGWTTNVKRRLKAINDHIPAEVVPDLWKLVYSEKCATKKEAFAVEQAVLAALSNHRTSGERARCSERAFATGWAAGIAIARNSTHPPRDR